MPQTSYCRVCLIQVLDLSHNQLEFVPGPGLGRLTSLARLDVSGNRLQALPDTLAALERLQLLAASENRLRALPATPLPPSVCSLELGR